MGRTTRVLLRMTLGTPWRQASDEQRQRIGERWLKALDEWKSDPGIRFICYYVSYGARADGYPHCYVFEVDDVSKVHKIGTAFDADPERTSVPERFSIDIVWGDTDVDQYWRS